MLPADPIADSTVSVLNMLELENMFVLKAMRISADDWGNDLEFQHAAWLFTI